MTAVVVAPSTDVKSLGGDNCCQALEPKIVGHRPRYDDANPAERLARVVDEFQAEGVSASALSEWMGLSRTQLQLARQRMARGHSCTIDIWIRIAERIRPRLEWWIYGEPPRGYDASTIAPRVLQWREERRREEQTREARRTESTPPPSSAEQALPIPIHSSRHPR